MFSWLRNALDLLRLIDGLMAVEKKHGAALEDLKDRVARLEAAMPMLLIEAKSVSATAASVAASQHLGDLAHRLGMLEERTRAAPHRQTVPRLNSH